MAAHGLCGEQSNSNLSAFVRVGELPIFGADKLLEPNLNPWGRHAGVSSPVIPRMSAVIGLLAATGQGANTFDHLQTVLGL